jgi:hypothetical protein
MSRLVRLSSCLVLGALASAGCAARSTVLGRSVTLVPAAQDAKPVKGELLAVEEGRVYVRTKDGVRDVDVSGLREVKVRRHDLGAGWAIRWGLVGGLVSGAVMAAACSSVEGNDAGGCAATGAVWGGIWMLAGLLAAPSLEGSSQLSFSPDSVRLAPYARFPAGLPKGARPESVLAGPPEPKPRR